MSTLPSTRLYLRYLTSNTQRLLAQHHKQLLGSIARPSSTKISTEIKSGIYQISISNPQAPNPTPLVMVHGFGSSGILYHRNLVGLSQQFQQIYAIDLPDCGLSDKTDFEVGQFTETVALEPVRKDVFKYTVDRDTQQAARVINSVKKFYADRLNNWLSTNNLGRVNLLGHSFGGLISYHYTKHNASKVDKLCLVSPVGMERNILSINNSTFTGVTNNDNPLSSNYYRQFANQTRLLQFIFTNGFTVLKALGPLGMYMIRRYLTRRYMRGSTDTQQIDLLTSITTLLFFQRTKSHDCLITLLNNSLMSRDPIADDLKLDLPVQFIYGQYDWMNVNAGYLASQKSPNFQFDIVEKAGHNLFLDNPLQFNAKIVNFFNK